MRSAVEPPFDRRSVIVPHRFSRQQVCNRILIDLAIMIPSPPQVDQHVSIFWVVADALYETTSSDGVTSKWGEVDQTTIFDIHGLSFRGRCGPARRSDWGP